MIDYDAAAGTAPSTGNVPFLEPDCDHKLLVVESKNQEGVKGNRYIIKVRVLESKATGKTEAPLPGAERCVILNLDPPKDKTKPDYGVKNLMGYAYALNGGPPSSAEHLKKLLGARKIDPAEAQRYRVAPQDEIKAFAIGMVVGDRSVGSMTTTGTPHPITYHNWYTIKQSPEEVLARKAALAEGRPVEWKPTL